MALFRKFHKWLGLLIGLQVTLWMISGLVMGLLDHDKVQGIATRAVVPAAGLGDAPVITPGELRRQLPADAEVSAIGLTMLLDRRVYRVVTGDGARLFDARFGNPLAIDERLAVDVARRDYTGDGSVVGVQPVEAPMMEVRKHSGPVWRVNFDDPANTSIYVSARDGRILERRNDTWRLFDVFWMLHIMDYAEREDFNNALVILVGLAAAFFSVTGLTLLFDSFGRDDFRVLLPSRWAGRPVPVTVHGPSGEVVSRFEATRGQRLYDALSGGGLTLPSNCGGGGTCGLCEVNLGAGAPLTDADLRLLPKVKRDAGVRLSCQARVADRLAVTIARESLEADRIVGRVCAVRCVTPFIREITLDLGGLDFDYRAGSYVHAVVPPHRVALSELDVPYEVRRAWGRDISDLVSDCPIEIRRAYSLATPCRDHPGKLVLNVRLILPPADIDNAPVGAGSGYMWSLDRGDTLDFIGPLGDFHAEPSARDMVVIGGGAGMAPLRAMIRDQLLHEKSSRNVDFWYGARSRADLFYVDELDGLAAAHSNFRWQPVLSAPAWDDNWHGPVGLVHAVALDALQNARRDFDACDFFLCGPPAMLDATRAALARLGVPEERVAFDDFGI